MSKGSTSKGNTGKGEGRSSGAGKGAGKGSGKHVHRTRMAPGVQAFTGKDSKGKPVTMLVKPRGPIPVGHVKKDWTKSGTSLVQIRKAERLPVEATPLAGGKADKAGLDTRGKVVTALKASGMKTVTAKAQLSKGTKVEMEHTKSKRVAQHIASDHLTEIPDYYTRLEKMEAAGASTQKAQALASVIDAKPGARAASLAGNTVGQQQLANRIGTTIGRLSKFAGKLGGTRPASMIDRLETLRNQWAAAKTVDEQAKLVGDLKDTLHNAQSFERGLQRKELDLARSALKSITTQIDRRRSSTEEGYRNLGIKEYSAMEAEKAALEEHVKELEAGKLLPRPNMEVIREIGSDRGEKAYWEMQRASEDVARRIEGRKAALVTKKENALEAAKKAYERTSAHTNTPGQEIVKPAHEAVMVAEARVKDAFQYKKPASEKRAAIKDLEGAVKDADLAADAAAEIITGRDYHGGFIAEGGASKSVTATILTQRPSDRPRQEMEVFDSAKQAEAWIDRERKKATFRPWPNDSEKKSEA